MKRSRVFYAVSNALVLSAAITSTQALSTDVNHMEVIKVTSSIKHDSQNTIAVNDPAALVGANQSDVGQWLNDIAGSAAVNNGPITSIAQYRGYSGKRVGISVNGQSIASAGPNSMDSPLSYAVAGAVDSMTIYRGITPVSVNATGLGGTIEIQQGQAQFSNNSAFDTSGLVFAQLSRQGDGTNLTGDINIGSRQHALRLVSSYQGADDYTDGDDRDVVSSAYQRNQTMINYAFRPSSSVASSNDEIRFFYQRTNTNESGTPALPMDIDYIDADQFTLSGSNTLSLGLLDWSISSTSAEHGMSNYMQRMSMASMTRYNTAEVDSFSANVSLDTDINDSISVKYGVSHNTATHDATITSPDNMMFLIANFSDIEQTNTSVFVDADVLLDTVFGSIITQQLDAAKLNLGIKITDHQSDAGDVSHHMAMMNSNIASLQTRFNSDNGPKDTTLVDLVVSITTPLTSRTNAVVSVAQKERAPTYQERYLWVPMQSTGGLADGYTYIGDPNLATESAHQFNIGVEYQTDTLLISPQAFYHSIDNYITATPSTDMAANMVAMMMTGQAPLAFANIDANIWGMDLIVNKQFTPEFSVLGSLSMIRGEREDIDDHLYRIAADKAVITLKYQLNDWDLAVQQSLTAAQNKVASVNNEQGSAGYGLTNVYAQTQVAQFNVKLGIDNVFDKMYQDHLNGRVRPAMTSIPQNDIIPGLGRNLYVSATYQF